MQFARWVFRLAGVWGLLVLTPMFFFETQIGIDQPPPITHPEFYYGFLGVAFAWQVAFLIISLDPLAYRLFMVPAMIEKFSFTAATTVLFLQGRLAHLGFAMGILDFILGVLFALAFIRTMPETKENGSVQNNRTI